MSGGHFDYQQFIIGSLADQLEQDIKYNDIPSNSIAADDYDELYGFQLKPETLIFLKKVVVQMRQLGNVLNEYDYLVSGDTLEKDFLEFIKNVRL